MVTAPRRSDDADARRAGTTALPATDPRALLASVVASAGFIHVAATFQHTDEQWTLPAFFAVLAVAQLLAAWWIVRRPTGDRLLKAVAVVSAVVATLWFFSRTTGVPYSPEHGVEKIGIGDTIATLLEVGAVALVVSLVRRPGRRYAWLSSPIGLRMTYAVLSAAMLTGALGGHKH